MYDVESLIRLFENLFKILCSNGNGNICFFISIMILDLIQIRILLILRSDGEMDLLDMNLFISSEPNALIGEHRAAVSRSAEQQTN